MSSKLTAEHLCRRAIIYVRQSTPSQVQEHKESQRRQYELAPRAQQLGFSEVEVIDEDLGRSGSGQQKRPGFERLVAAVCSGAVGAVFCIEASRLARNGRDWHHLIDLCALVGTVVVDPDGIYDPRQSNDRLLLGLKGSMSEYELSLLRQRSLAARDAKAQRGELQIALPPGYLWDEAGQIELDPDERIRGVVHLVFNKFLELGSVRQVALWMQHNGLPMPVLRQGKPAARIEWKEAAYANLLAMIQNPIYAGAYVFGRTESRTRVDKDRALKTSGHHKPPPRWSVLLREHHPSYISWDEFQRNQQMLADNAYMQNRTGRKSGRGGRALLTGLLRCGRCARMMRVWYGSGPGRVHRYQCRGGLDQAVGKSCVGVGGVRIDRAVSAELLQAVTPHAVQAALQAAEQVVRQKEDAQAALARELEAAQYQAALAARRYESVDPAKRLVARELEARWEQALIAVRDVERRRTALQQEAVAAPGPSKEELLRLAQDLQRVWNAEDAEMRLKQHIVRILLKEILVVSDDTTNEVVLTLHWSGGRHSEVRIKRVKTGRYPVEPKPDGVEAVQKMAGRWPDREVAVALNRMRCKREDGSTWTETCVRTLRERLGIAPFAPAAAKERTVSMEEAARTLGICIGSVRRLIRDKILPATQVMRAAPWQIPASALDSEEVRQGARAIIDRRPVSLQHLEQARTLRLPTL
jgi:DNA invertase Pin-like site-specific DNA recombinase